MISACCTIDILKTKCLPKFFFNMGEIAVAAAAAASSLAAIRYFEDFCMLIKWAIFLSLFQLSITSKLRKS